MEIYRYLWLKFSLGKYSQGVSQLHTNLCKTHKQNTHVQHSYTHRTINNPRTEAWLTQELMYICITSSEQGLIHTTQAAGASRISTHRGNVQASVTSAYPSVGHSVCFSVTHTHIDLNNTTHTQIDVTSLIIIYTHTDTHAWLGRFLGSFWAIPVLWVQIPSASFSNLNPLFLSRRQIQRKRANLSGLRTLQTLMSVLQLQKMHKEICFSPS